MVAFFFSSRDPVIEEQRCWKTEMNANPFQCDSKIHCITCNNVHDVVVVIYIPVFSIRLACIS